MRPVRLQLKGFTAFRDEQTLEFEGLDLFAISGPTGSGKSSLLDAMTYALYGYVDRVGKQVGQLISQGQPRMAVTLEFAVGTERYRVTRSTQVARATRVLLERWVDGEWRQAGEGSDRVLDVNARVREIVGLDYDAFTRSVLLPQGKFAEFLVGDPRKRREILTELLGLELFERLARRSGDLGREAEHKGQAKDEVLRTEYAGVTEEALRRAEGEEREARGREEGLLAAEEKVRGLSRRWEEIQRGVRDLKECAADARDAAAVAATAAARLRDLVEELARAEELLRARSREAAKAEEAAERAVKARERAEARWGRVADVAATRGRAEGLAALRDEVEGLRGQLEAARAGLPGLEERLERAERALADRRAARDGAERALAAAREALGRAQHANLVAAVRAGIRVGEPCPVCGTPVETLPDVPRAPDLERARAEEARAEEARRGAEQAEGRAERDRDRARSSLDRAGEEVDRLKNDLRRRTAQLGRLERDLTAGFGGRLPVDPVAVLTERMGKLEELIGAEREAADVARAAAEERSGAERAADGLRADVDRERGRLEGLAVARVLGRARELAGDRVAVAALPPAPVDADPAALSEAAAALAGGLEDLAAGLDELAEGAAGAHAELLREAAEAVGELVGAAGTLEELMAAVGGARLEAGAAAATAAQAVADLRKRLERRAALEEEVRDLRSRAERFETLARELRQDRLVAFLQLEALQVLAAAASDHLATLSGGRYRLAYEGDEFSVVDTWNGDEQRSARTLSGGETFLASLALALALSEQVRSLSVTEKARLESLFLDEGFGTLDPDTLEVVVEAIEQLGGDGRMVGVITHVQELAIRLPIRVEVEKSPRGSRVRLVS